MAEEELSWGPEFGSLHLTLGRQEEGRTYYFLSGELFAGVTLN